MMIDPPCRLHLGDQTPEVPGRPGIARSDRDRQQTLCSDPALGLRDPLRDDGTHTVVVMHHPLRWPRPLRGLDDSLHGLVRSAAYLGGAPIRAYLPVGGIDVHTFPH